MSVISFNMPVGLTRDIYPRTQTLDSVIIQSNIPQIQNFWDLNLVLEVFNAVCYQLCYVGIPVGLNL